MNQDISAFGKGILTLCYFVMHCVGYVDNGLIYLGNQAGVSPVYQLYILLVLIAVLVAFALRVVGGIVGWFVLLFLVLLLLHRVVPGADSPAFNTPIQNVLK